MDEAQHSRSDKSRPWRGAGLPGESWSGERPPRPSWGARAPRRCLLSTMPKVPPLLGSPRRPKCRVPWAKHAKPLRLHSHWTIKMTEAPRSPTRWKPHGAPRGLHLLLFGRKGRKKRNENEEQSVFTPGQTGVPPSGAHGLLQPSERPEDPRSAPRGGRPGPVAWRPILPQ